MKEYIHIYFGGYHVGIIVPLAIGLHFITQFYRVMEKSHYYTDYSSNWRLIGTPIVWSSFILLQWIRYIEMEIQFQIFINWCVILFFLFIPACILVIIQESNFYYKNIDVVMLVAKLLRILHIIIAFFLFYVVIELGTGFAWWLYARLALSTGLFGVFLAMSLTTLLCPKFGSSEHK